MKQVDKKTPVPLLAGLLGKCPRCKKAGLFKGFLDMAEECPSCKLDYTPFDSADGPAFFIGFLLLAIFIPAVAYVEMVYQPEYWVHVVLWVPLILFLSLALLRPFKGLVVALQYHFKAGAWGQNKDGCPPNDG